LRGLKDVGYLGSSDADEPRRRQKLSGLQVEDEENDPDRLPDEAVEVTLRVPLTVAVVPDAVSAERVKVADPEPPATSLSSASVSSITISIFSLLNSRWLMARGNLRLKILGARKRTLTLVRLRCKRYLWLRSLLTNTPAVIKKSTTPISRLVARRWRGRRTALA
jgi:hypothetical protein